MEARRGALTGARERVCVVPRGGSRGESTRSRRLVVRDARRERARARDAQRNVTQNDDVRAKLPCVARGAV